MYRASFVSSVLQVAALSTAMITNAGAVTLCVAGYCDSTYVPPTEIVGPIQGPSVSPEPSELQLIPFQNSNGWNYFFSVGGADIVTVSMPYFDGWDMSQVNTPEGWTYQVVEASAGQPNDLAYWELQNGSLGYYSVGASFLSSFAPTLATVEIRNTVGTIFEKQVFIPLSPSAIEAGYTAASLPVPEPSNALLFAAGMAMLVTVLRAKNSSNSNSSIHPHEG